MGFEIPGTGDPVQRYIISADPFPKIVSNMCTPKAQIAVTSCTRLPPTYVLCSCLAQYGRRDFFGMQVEYIEYDKRFFWLHLNFYFITTAFLFVESD